MKDFLEHLSLKNPGFVCYKSGYVSEKEAPKKVFPIVHRLGQPATKEEISTLVRILPEENDQLVDLYSNFNGGALYCCGEMAGFSFPAISKLANLNEGWKVWIEDIEEEDLCEFQKDGFAFAEIFASGNYFVLHDGKVFLGNHEGGDQEPFSQDIFSLLSRMVRDPGLFFWQTGGIVRFREGKELWIPKQFLPDVSSYQSP